MEKITPRTDDAREASMTVAKNRKDGVLPADNIFSVDNTAALDFHLPLFSGIRNRLRIAEEGYHDNVKLLEAAFEKGKFIASHICQMVNFMIIDGKLSWTISSRTFYGMILDGHLPPMTSHREIIEALNDVIKGETDHIADGGVALKDITKADAVAALADINDKMAWVQDSKDAIVEIEKELKDERKEIDKLMPLLWSDIEHKAQGLTKGASHTFGLLWGMQYKNTKGLGILNASVEDEATHEKLAGISIRLGSPDGKEGAKTISNLHGEAILESHNLKDTFVVVQDVRYDFYSRAVILTAGEELTILIKLKKKNIE